MEILSNRKHMAKSNKYSNIFSVKLMAFKRFTVSASSGSRQHFTYMRHFLLTKNFNKTNLSPCRAFFVGISYVDTY